MIVGAVCVDLQSGILMSPTALVSDWHIWWSDYHRAMFGEVASAFYNATFKNEVISIGFALLLCKVHSSTVVVVVDKS